MNNERKIVIDEEMTGLDLPGGDRIVEIGAVEMIRGRPTGKTFHRYINPEGRPMSPSAAAVTGLTDNFLTGQPRFSEVAPGLLEFIGNSKIVVYCRIDKNSCADQNFLNNELRLAGLSPIPKGQWKNMRYWVRDLALPGQGSLNAQLDKYDIDHAGRDEACGHGALSDAKLTAELYPKLKADWNKVAGKKAKTSKQRQTLKRNSIRSPSFTV